MTSLFWGIVCFLLYFLYDINSFTIQSKPLHYAFAAGTVILAAATGADLYAAWRVGAFSGVSDALFLLLSFLCFLCLIYCLFFALPFHETYSEQTTGQAVCDKGVYALCRHPGILCFFGMFLFLGIAALPTRLLLHGMVYSTLNLVYALFQDRITFPKTFYDYHMYRERVPFLFPTINSIRLARESWPVKDSKEDVS